MKGIFNNVSAALQSWSSVCAVAGAVTGTACCCSMTCLSPVDQAMQLTTLTFPPVTTQ